MSSNVTTLLLVLLFLIIGIFIVVTWIRWAVENVRFGIGMFETLKTAKQRWESQRAIQSTQSIPTPQPPAVPGEGERPGPTPGDGARSAQP
jgi:hypothetical protein